MDTSPCEAVCLRSCRLVSRRGLRGPGLRLQSLRIRSSLADSQHPHNINMMTTSSARCRRCGSLSYEDIDGDSRCWICGRLVAVSRPKEAEPIATYRSRGRPAISPVKRAAIVKLRNEGHSKRDITARMQVSLATVKRVIKREKGIVFYGLG